MQDIITIGSALTDIFVKSPHFEVENHLDGVKLCQMYGEKLEADSFVVETGGGGGKDIFSSVIIDEFHREYVSTNFVVEERKEQTGGSVILVGRDGGRTVLVHRGASSQLDPQDIPGRAIKTAKWVHLSSIAGQLETLKFIGSCMQESKTKLSWNPGRGELALLTTGELKVTDIPCEILFVNLQEWESVSALHDQLKQHCTEIVVTNGHSQGVIYVKNGPQQEITFMPTKTQVVDETGAGDAFSVGYVAARILDQQPETAVSWGLKNATSVIKYFGAKPGLLTKEKLAAVQ
jgi:sugar/nucleoside kinase (ribokinase family)